MAADPLQRIEEAAGQRDMGVIGRRIYAGARDDGASRLDALHVTAAWFLAVLKNMEIPPEDDAQP